MKTTLISPTRQGGIALFMVLILLLLSVTAVLGAFRVASLNETLLGNTSDYNRAYAAAEAMIRDAEIDIRGRRPPYTTVQADGNLGFPCRPDPDGSTTSNIVKAGFVGCRNQAGGGPWIPRSSDEFDTVSILATSTVNSTTYPCLNAICVPPNITTLDNIHNNWADFRLLGATYGQHTRTDLATAPGVSGNPILNGTGNPAEARYLIEIFRYAQVVNNTNVAVSDLVPDPLQPYVYRITAIARGLKPGTEVIIKSIFVPVPASQNR